MYRSIPFYDSANIITISVARDTDGIKKELEVSREVQCRMTDGWSSANTLASSQKDMRNYGRLMYLDKEDPISNDDIVEFEGDRLRVESIYRPRASKNIHHIKVYLNYIKNG